MSPERSPRRNTLRTDAPSQDLVKKLAEYKDPFLWEEFPIEQGLEKISKTRFSFLVEAMNWRREFPETPVNVSELGRRLGVSKERARQIYNETAQEQFLPPKGQRGNRRRYTTLLLDTRIKESIAHGLSTNEIAELLKLPKRAISASRRRLRRRKEIPPQQLLSAEEIKSRDEKIIALRNQGKGNAQIARELDMNLSTVNNRLCLLMSRGEAIRLRKVRRTKEETIEFHAVAKYLRDQEGLSNRQIAEKLGVRASEVVGAIKGMLDSGKVERKRPFRPRKKK